MRNKTREEAGKLGRRREGKKKYFLIKNTKTIKVIQ